MNLPKNKEVLEDCIYILKVIKNMDYIDTTRYLFSNDLNTLELTDSMKVYFTKELISPLNEKLNKLSDEKDVMDNCHIDSLKTDIDNVIKNGFKKGNFESYRFILDEIICDDSYDLYKIISARIEKDKENLNSEFE